jgi:hypothetical protein
MAAFDAARREAQEDLYYGQVVIIISRWALIVAGIVLTLWSARGIGDVSLTVVCMASLMAMNFYLHGRYVMDQPVNARLVYVSCAIDLIAIVALVFFWAPGKAPGLESPFFVFLYPALFAFALVFRPRATAIFSATAILAYLGVLLVTSGVHGVGETRTVVERVITLAATAGLGTFFWRYQRARRAAVAHHRADLLDEVADLTGTHG